MIRLVAARGAAAAGPDRETRCRLALPRKARRLGHGPSAVRLSSPTKAGRAWGFGRGAAQRRRARRRLAAFPRKHPLRSILCSFIGLCPRGRMFIFVDGRARRRLGRFFGIPAPSPAPAEAGLGLFGTGPMAPALAAVLIVSWVVCFGGVHSLLLAARAAFFLLGCALRFAPSAPRLSPCFFWRGIRLAFARQDRAANRGRAQSRAESGASAHFIF